jgi:hypothetical protein
MRPHRVLFLASALLAALLAFPSVARGQTSPTPTDDASRHFGGQRTFAFGPIVGLNGTGALAGAQLAPVGLWVSGGYVPLLVFGNKHDTDRTPTLDAYGSAELNVDVSVLPILASPRIDAGVIAGYRYNSLLAHGVGAGVAMVYDLSPTFAVFLSVECNVFPQAQQQLTNAGYPGDRDPAIPWLQGGANVGLLVFP